MNHAPVKLGPLALLLTVISICLTILAILTYTTAGADDRLAQRYAQTTTERYELEIDGQEALAEFPAGFEANAEYDELLATQAEAVLWKTIEQDGLVLTIGATPGTDGPQVVTWKVSRQWEQDGLIHNLWDGE